MQPSFGNANELHRPQRIIDPMVKKSPIRKARSRLVVSPVLHVGSERVCRRSNKNFSLRFDHESAGIPPCCRRASNCCGGGVVSATEARLGGAASSLP
jgi:hypothetical protein